jgi:hypothetical protein
MTVLRGVDVHDKQDAKMSGFICWVHLLRIAYRDTASIYFFENK